MLQKMRHTVLIDGLVAGADLDPDADNDRPEGRSCSMTTGMPLLSVRFVYIVVVRDGAPENAGDRVIVQDSADPVNPARYSRIHRFHHLTPEPSVRAGHPFC